MRRIRVIPVLLLHEGGLVKTTRFKNPNYIGDPINAVKIFNEKEVDELALIDINCTTAQRPPNFQHIESIVSEAFMPLAYGGGIASADIARRVFDCGVEKLIINAAATAQPSLITQIATVYGSQSVVVSVDVRKGFLGGYHVYTHNGKKKLSVSLVDYLKTIESLGAGEIILTHIDHEGTFNGYDFHLYEKAAGVLQIPLVANGGARSVDDFRQAVLAGASAVAAGSFFVYKGRERGILINYPTQQELTESIFKRI